MEKIYYIYMMASKKNGTIYVGMTDDMKRRNMEHKLRRYDGFTSRYGVDNLVYFECVSDPTEAVIREKKLIGLLRKNENFNN